MPALKQLTCQIEHGLTQDCYREYGTTYGDGLVETFVCVPAQREPFAIHLTSKGYIAPGLAMFVYMDGVYQCNRNRYNLKFTETGLHAKYTDIDFRVRQKEEKGKDGYFVGREWRFEGLKVLDTASTGAASRHFDHLGEIQVIILRCVPNDGSHLPFLTGSDTSSYTAESEPKHTPTAPFAEEEKVNPMQAFVTEVEDEQPGLGGLFDGPAERPRRVSQQGAGDPRLQSQSQGQNYGWSYTNPERTEGIYGPGNGQGPFSPAPSKTTQNMPMRHVSGGNHDGNASMYGGRPVEPRGGSGRGGSNNNGPSQQNEISWRQQGNGGSQDRGWNNARQPQQRNFNSPAREQQSWNRPDMPSNGSRRDWVREDTGPALRQAFYESQYGQHIDPQHVPQGEMNYGHPTQNMDGYGNIDQNGGSFGPSMQGQHGGLPPLAQPPVAASPYYGYPPAYPAAYPGVYPGWGYPPPGNYYPPTPYLSQGGRGPSRTHNGPQPWNDGHGQWQGPSRSYPHSKANYQADTGPNEGQFPSGGAEHLQAGNDANATVADPWAVENNQASGGDNGGNDQDGQNGNPNDPWAVENNQVSSGDNRGNDQPGQNADTGDTWGDGNNQAAAVDDWGQDKNGQNGNAGDAWGGDNQASGGDNWGNNGNVETANSGAQPLWNNGTAQNGFDNNPPSGGGSWENDQNGANGGDNKPSAWDAPAQGNQTNETNRWNADPSVAFGKADSAQIVGPYGPVYGSEDADLDEGLEPEPVRYIVPRDVAEEKNTTHQVQPGKGHTYLHKILRPKYMDSIDQPYAMFVFKYRSKEVVEQTLGITIEEPKIVVDPDTERRRLERMTREQLIEHLLRERVEPTEACASQKAGSGAQEIPTEASRGMRELQPPNNEFLKYKSSLPNPVNSGLGIALDPFLSNTGAGNTWGEDNGGNNNAGDAWNVNNSGSAAKLSSEQGFSVTPGPQEHGANGFGNAGGWDNGGSGTGNAPAPVGNW